MTTYTTITDGQVDASSPIDETLMVSLRDNLIAFIEADPTAPKASWVAMEHIETYTADNSDTYVEFTSLDNARYSSYLLVLKNAKPNSNARGLWLQTSTNGGTSYDAGATDYSTGGAGYTSTSDEAVLITLPNGVGNAAGEDGATGEIRIMPSDGTVNNQVTFAVVYEDDTGAMEYGAGGGKRNSDTTVDAFRIFYAGVSDPTSSTTTMVSGTLTLYGLRNSST